ncbi:MAG: DUF5118 domain-containing protein [Gracilimonas sp.]|nr:DUF5118 domain-containing protein [Gracilimonas sp.]
MNYRKFNGTTLAVLFLSLTFVFAGCKTAENAAQASKSSSTNGAKSGSGSDDEMKKYSDVITDEAETDEGLFNVHKVDEKYYYEIPDEHLGKEMLLVTRVAKTADNVGYGGEKLNTQVIRWEKKDDKILLRHVSHENVASEEEPIL